ncbi:DciA family protein [Chlamydiifrater phoenicopteri]|uniref:DciA family protein n=1 Tax=Chlamydiifrater phoenicopteri TaxID=2681469 RepID=UPI001BCE09FD|nr:DciA family protein [Chlamydiifrater phoenicopteri]
MFSESRIKHPKASPTKKSRTATTIKHMSHVLSKYLEDLEKLRKTDPQQLIKAWHAIMDPKYKGMTAAVGYQDEELLVKVSNSSLFSILKQTNQKSLLEQLKTLSPRTPVKKIYFLFGTSHECK